MLGAWAGRIVCKQESDNPIYRPLRLDSRQVLGPDPFAADGASVITGPGHQPRA